MSAADAEASRPDGAARLAEIRAGGKAALARALTALERKPDAAENAALLDAAWASPQGPAIGLTGPPGVGKSTLIDALVRAQRRQGRSVAVIAVDPSSKRSGGAVLGDRTRLSTDPTDAGVFVRSMAARDRLGGVSEQAYPASVLLRALFDLTIIETVGVGQSETEVAEIADAVVFCIQPGSGDSLQFMKAGVMEIPDLLLVTKADLGAPARRAAADAKSALSLGAQDATPPEVRLVSATGSATGGAEGVDAALEDMARIAARQATPERRSRQAEAWRAREAALAFGREGVRLLSGQAAGRASGQAAGQLDSPSGSAAASDRPFSRHAAAMAELRRRLASRTG